MTGAPRRYAGLSLALAAAACTMRPPPQGGAPIIDRVDVRGAEDVSPAGIEESIATTETKRILGGALEDVPIMSAVDAVTVEYHTLDRLVMAQDMARVRRYLRARGFYEALVRAGRVIPTEDGHVRVEISIDEGDAVLVEALDYVFPEARNPLGMSPEQAKAVHEADTALFELRQEFLASRSSSGDVAPRFDEADYDNLKRAMRRALTDRGFAYAEVKGAVDVDLARRRARVVIAIDAGPLCSFGDIQIVGSGEIPAESVREQVDLTPDTRYSTAELEQARRAVAGMEVFGSIEVKADRTPSPSVPDPNKTDGPPAEPPPRRTRIPVVIRLQPVDLRGVKAGLGAEIGTRVDAHGVFGWEDKNFLGGRRLFSVELRPSVVFYPMRVDTLFSQPPTNVFFEADLRLGFEQPAFIERKTTLDVDAGARIYLPRTFVIPDNREDAKNINAVGYREIDGTIGPKRKFQLTDDLDLEAGQYVALQFDDPFSYNQDDIPVGYEQILIPYLETRLKTDVWIGERDDEERSILASHKGFSVGLNFQVATLGDAEDVRISPDLRGYVPVADDLLFAMRWTTGFLFPRNFGDTLITNTPSALDLQLISFRGFFSGGPSSNRGYGFREVGPHRQLPYLFPAAVDGDGNGLLDGVPFLPAGGIGMWELSGELRFPLGEALVGVIFVDASDVVESLAAFRVTHPHIAPGLGIRYVSPVGKVRLDLGFRPPYLQKAGAVELELEEGGCPNAAEVAGLCTGSIPIAFNLAIGEAI